MIIQIHSNEFFSFSRGAVFEMGVVCIPPFGVVAVRFSLAIRNPHGACDLTIFAIPTEKVER